MGVSFFKANKRIIYSASLILRFRFLIGIYPQSLFLPRLISDRSVLVRLLLQLDISTPIYTPIDTKSRSSIDAIAAMQVQGHPLHLAAAAVYVRLVVDNLTTTASPRRSHRLLRLLRLRRHHDYRRLRFPAAVAAALDDLEDLYSQQGRPGGEPITMAAAAFARHGIRRERARHVARLRAAASLRLSVAGAIRGLAVRSTATRRCVETARGLIRQTQRLLPVGERDLDGGGEATTTERVVTVVEFLATFQGMEAELEADMEAMGPEHERLLRRHDAAVGAELAEAAALEAIPELPPATEEEAQLVREACRRVLSDLVVLIGFFKAVANYLRD